MTTLGVSQLIDLALPATIDFRLVTQFAMREGLTLESALALASTVIGQVNEELVAMYGGIAYVTSERYRLIEQGNSVRTMTPKKSEYGKTAGVGSEEAGFMLALDKYEDEAPWTVDFLREATTSRLTMTMNTVRNRWRNRVDYDVIWRLLRTDEVAVGGGWAPGWAIGSGTNTNYIPPQWMTESFTSSHTHYGFTAGVPAAANVLAAIQTGAAEVQHHGHSGDKIAFVGTAMAALLTGSNDKRIGLVTPERFRLLGGNSNAPIATVVGQLEGVPGELACYVNTDDGLVSVLKHPRVPAGYLWVGKAYGPDDNRNPLAIAIDPLRGGFGLMPRIKVTATLPAEINGVMFEASHGVNVWDRTAGYAHYIANGASAYVNPTISA